MPKLIESELSMVGAFFFLVVPWMVLIYAGFLLFVRPPKKVFLTSLLGGTVLAAVNILVDLAAFYAQWWHYTLNELILHIPLPFYLSPLFLFGSLVYLLIWRFWRSKRWFSLLLLVGVPLFCIIRDIWGGLAHTSYQEWEQPVFALLATVLMWSGGFFAGFALFWRFSSQVEPAKKQDEPQHAGHAG